jgi:transcription antitermination factor NusG
MRLRGLEEYLPLYLSRRLWSDRVKEVEFPLFPGYVFCRFDSRTRFTALNTPGVTSIVGFGKTDVPVEDSELAAIRTILASGLPVGPWPHLRAGDRVRIEGGALAGIEGTLVCEKSAWRLVVSIELLQRSVAVEIDRELVGVPPASRTFRPFPGLASSPVPFGR